MCISYGSKSSKSPIVPVLLLVSTYEAICVACVCMHAQVCTHRCLHMCLLTHIHLCAHMVDALSCSARWSEPLPFAYNETHRFAFCSGCFPFFIIHIKCYKHLTL